MKSKAEIIRENLASLSVLDLGGSGYGEDNPYENELREAWALTKQRSTVDVSEGADIQVNLNSLPLPNAPDGYDITTAFDVLEHLDHPADILRWVPTPSMIITLPNALSFLARRMEEKGNFPHLYSFTPYTASVLVRSAGWKIDKTYFTFGKWSAVARIINAVGSLSPKHVGTGIVLHCRRP